MIYRSMAVTTGATGIFNCQEKFCVGCEKFCCVKKPVVPGVGVVDQLLSLQVSIDVVCNSLLNLQSYLHMILVSLNSFIIEKEVF
jgi:hypothetical protein